MTSTEKKHTLVAEPGNYAIIVTRTFDAPRELVYKALTDPEQIPQWWGPAKYKTIVDKMDVRPGGQWRFVQYDAEGAEFSFHGVYHDLVEGRGVVQTFEYEGVPGHVLLETMNLEDVDGKTKMTNTSVFQSVEDRDGMLQAGMESGMAEGFDRLAGLVEKP